LTDVINAAIMGISTEKSLKTEVPGAGHLRLDSSSALRVSLTRLLSKDKKNIKVTHKKVKGNNICIRKRIKGL
jgi:hypothetical protein